MYGEKEELTLNIKGLIIYLVFLATSFIALHIGLGLDTKYIIVLPLILLLGAIYYYLVDGVVYYDC